MVRSHSIKRCSYFAVQIAIFDLVVVYPFSISKLISNLHISLIRREGQTLFTMQE